MRGEREGARWEERGAAVCCSLRVCVCVSSVCGVIMVLIGAAIKSVLKYLNRTRGECVCVCLSVCLCVCYHSFICAPAMG